MEAEILLQQLCERHGVDLTHGQPLLPLVRWALKGPDESRRKILEVVELALRGNPGTAERTPGDLIEAADQAILVAVARVLHGWAPKSDLLDLDLEARRERLDPEDVD